jgi:hypothetical protein
VEQGVSERLSLCGNRLGSFALCAKLHAGQGVTRMSGEHTFIVRRDVKNAKEFFMKMKRMRRVLVLFAAMTAFVLAGCNGMPAHYGQIAAPEPGTEFCTMIIPSILRITHPSFRHQFGAIAFWSVVQIPAGTHELVFDYRTSWSSQSGSTVTTTTEWADGMSVVHEFQPGKRYEAVPVQSGRSVRVEIKETERAILGGVRFGLFPGWLSGSGNAPVGGIYATVQGGITTAGSIPVEVLAEGNVGIGYAPLTDTMNALGEINSESKGAPDYNMQFGGTVNAYFGKKKKKAGLGLGGGLSLGGEAKVINEWTWDDGSIHINREWVDIWKPYVRLSFFPPSENNIRLFMDYSFTDEDLIKRLGFGAQFFFDMN